MQQGSIRETDAITLIIKDFILRIKKARNNQPFILILDDLDRLDPEQVFRVYNLFTAHHDSRSEANKFDFDQVIFVCDIKNIGHMFQHKFGKDVDFGGYIDKFYSSHIFEFNFRKHLSDLSEKLIITKQAGKNLQHKSVSNSIKSFFDLSNPRQEFHSMFFHLIKQMIGYDQLKIRNFERFHCFDIPRYTFNGLNGREYSAYNYPYLVLMNSLLQFFPRWIELEEALTVLCSKFIPDYATFESPTYYDDDNVNRRLIMHSLPFVLTVKDAFLTEGTGDNITFPFQSENGAELRIEYQKHRDGAIRLGRITTNEIFKDEEEKESYKTVGRANPYWFLLIAMRNCIKHGFLNQ